MPAVLLLLGSLITAQAAPVCTRSSDCLQLALDAAAREDFETFHSLAWRAVQTGPPNDPDLMFLLARAQALSGRPDDALVMLRRLADRGILHPETETLDEFRRVRNMAGWPTVLEKLHGVLPSTDLSVSPAVPTVAVAARPVIATPTTVATVAAPPLPPPVPHADPPTPVTPAVVTLSGIALIPPTVAAPLALAYDRVSARMIIADDASGTLKVLSDLSGNIADLVSRGWGGGYHSNALVIDSKRGDLWVVGTRIGEGPDSVVHHIQLISGRIITSIFPPPDAGATRFSAVALSSTSVFVLDAEGGRIFELPGAAKTLRLRITVPQRHLTGLTLASDTVAYVTHTNGILRIDLATKQVESVKAAPGISLDGVEWVAYFENSLLAIQRRPDGSMAAMRFRFDRRGRTVAAVDTFGAAAAKGAAVLGDTLYFVSPLPVGTAVARVNMKP